MRSFTYPRIVFGAALGIMLTAVACNRLSATAGESGETCDPGTASSSPPFPGSGMAGAGQPITTDLEPNSCGASMGSGSSVSGPPALTCYYQNGNTTPAAFVERVVETAENTTLVHVRLTMNPAFVDNTYGANALGWKSKTMPAGMKPPMPGPMPGGGGHKFDDLVGSDKAEFVMTDAAGQLVLDFYLDYISVNAAKPSGYGSLGVSGGDGKMLVGNASALIAWATSLDRDLNACGYGSYTTDSPATDENYTPNPLTPNWDYRVVYDVWVDQAAFGAAGFGDATIPYVHASPSKFSSDTVDVTPGPCPPPCDSPPPACTSEGDRCDGNGECCSGVCSEGWCVQVSCKQLGDTCIQSSDCCDAESACVDGLCVFQGPT